MEPIKSSILCVNLVLSVKIPVKFSRPNLIRTIFTRKHLGQGFRNPDKSKFSSTCHKYTTFPSCRNQECSVLASLKNLFQVNNEPNLHTVWLQFILLNRSDFFLFCNLSLMFNNLIALIIVLIKLIKC